jgi:hypothetical protein
VKHINDFIKYFAPHQKLTIPGAKDRIWTKVAISENACANQIQMPFDYL